MKPPCFSLFGHFALSLLIVLSLGLSPNLTGNLAAAETGALADFEDFADNPIAVYGREVHYEVFRDQKKIGKHVLVFDQGGDTLLVTAKSTLVVRLLGVPVYRYTYSAKEIWVDGKLASVESEIRDNRKKPRLIKAEVRGRVLEVTDRGSSRLLPLVEYASSHWHPGALSASRMFHTTHGRVRNVRIDNLGLDRIALQGSDGSTKVVDTTQYKISGGFSAELWYDKSNRWVRLRFKADDGSEIDYKCSSCDPH